jgi:hypothetical protein
MRNCSRDSQKLLVIDSCLGKREERILQQDPPSEPIDEPSSRRVSLSNRKFVQDCSGFCLKRNNTRERRRRIEQSVVCLTELVENLLAANLKCGGCLESVSISAHNFVVRTIANILRIAEKGTHYSRGTAWLPRPELQMTSDRQIANWNWGSINC